MNDGLVSGIWLRRSITGSEFVPFWSDIDVTIEINEVREMDLVRLSKKITNLTRCFPWICDIEIIHRDICNLWINFGGLKSKNVNTFIKIKDQNLFVKPKEIKKTSKTHYYFDIAWEFRFLWWQIEKIKIKKRNKKLELIDLVNLRKLLSEYIKIKLLIFDKKIMERSEANKLYIKNGFWSYGSHFKLLIYDSSLEFVFNVIDCLKNEIVNELSKKLKGLIDYSKSLENLALHIDGQGKISKKIFGQTAYIKDDKNISIDCVEEYVEMTKELYDLFMAIGVQEHDALYITTLDYRYLKKYLLVRLVQDYLQAFLLGHDSHILAYCRENISNFLIASKVDFSEHLPVKVEDFSESKMVQMFISSLLEFNKEIDVNDNSRYA